jgi:hypothetical protein
MAARGGHYGQAFEAFLKKRSIPYVDVAQAKKALFADAKLKSFDFVVYSEQGPNLLIDLNGRRCHRAGKAGQGPAGFQTWTGEADVSDLLTWEEVFGKEFKGLMTFIYWMERPKREPHPGMFQHQERWYMLMGVELAQYRARMRRRSAKWQTVALPAADFRSLARPLESWL